MEEEQENINYFGHDHPLCWIPNIVEAEWCHGCFRYFLGGEAGYGCNKCDFRLHEDCAEMARQIRHPLHPSHPLTLQSNPDTNVSFCAVCDLDLYGMVYCCSQGCKVAVHIVCTEGHVPILEEKQVMEHPSHPQHKLTLLRRRKRSCSFQCDACGTTQKGNSYICTICEYWIDESCAALPPTASFHHHHHSLSLAFQLPYEYFIYGFKCAMCGKAFQMRRWAYHCKLCRYAVHIKCATSSAPCCRNNNEDTADDPKDIISVPMKNIYEEIIRPFVERDRQGILVPSEEKINSEKHHHPLSLINLPVSSSHYHIEDDSKQEEDDGLEIKCDGCTLPIHERSSSTSNYLVCNECQFYLHLACFNLSPELSSHTLHQIPDHGLILQHSDKLSRHRWVRCWICEYKTNGFYYACNKCEFKLDIKCASLPDTIKHNAHPQDHHYLKLAHRTEGHSFLSSCFHIIDDKDRTFLPWFLYKCDRCEFSVCCKCVFLPERNKHRLEKHWLPLTYDAYVNHPSEFICGSCEEKMNPQWWMYYCRECEESFDLVCFPSTSGEYRNINFGMQQYSVRDHPHHLLRFQLITKKKYCNLCHQNAYEEPGFQCVSCNFIMCYDCIKNTSLIDR